MSRGFEVVYLFQVLSWLWRTSAVALIAGSASYLSVAFFGFSMGVAAHAVAAVGLVVAWAWKTFPVQQDKVATRKV